jgi:hypothetical protein
MSEGGTARSRSIRLTCPMSPFLNWSLCLTRAEEPLAPRSRVCACLDSLRGGLLTYENLSSRECLLFPFFAEDLRVRSHQMPIPMLNPFAYTKARKCSPILKQKS